MVIYHTAITGYLPQISLRLEGNTTYTLKSTKTTLGTSYAINYHITKNGNTNGTARKHTRHTLVDTGQWT